MSLQSNIDPRARLIIESAFDRIKKAVTFENAKSFDSTTLDDVRKGALSLEDELSRDALPNMGRLLPLFDKMESYGQSARSICNDDTCLNWLWAPILHCLRSSKTSISTMRLLLSSYKQLAMVLPDTDRSLIGEPLNTEHQELLAFIYADIIDIHLEINDLLHRHGWTFFFQSWWKASSPRIRLNIDNIGQQNHTFGQRLIKDAITEVRRQRESRQHCFEISAQKEATIKLNNVQAWLHSSSVNQDDILYRLRAQCHEGSCHWIYDNPKMQSWLDDGLEHRVVWLKGKPGAGKSVLCGELISNLQKRPESIVLYFLCIHPMLESQNTRSLLGSLVAQIILQQRNLCDFVLDQSVNQGQQPSIIQLQSLLTTLLSAFRKVRIIIDGLDECTEAEQRSMLSEILSLTRNKTNLKGLKILISSQDLVIISRALRDRTHIDLSEERAALQGAISSFVRSKVRDGHLYYEPEDIDDVQLDEIEHTLLNKADGMFLWVRLVISMLDQVYSIEEMQRAVDELPRGLDQMYTRILDKLQQRISDLNFDRAIRIFKWLTCCQRPLKRAELLDAISLYPGNTSINKNSRSFEHVFELCKPLVEIAPDDTVCLVHSSVKDYFSTTSARFTLLSAQETVTFSCVTYLTFGSTLLDDAVDDENRLSEVGKGYHSLCRYASTFWTEHFLTFVDLAAKVHSNIMDDSLVGAVNSLSTNLSLILSEPFNPPDTVLDPRCILLQDVGPASRLARCALAAQLNTKFGNKDYATDAYHRDPFIRMRQRYDALAERVLQADHVDGLSAGEIASFKKMYGSFTLICRQAGCKRGALGFKTIAERDAHEATHILRCPHSQCFQHRKGFKSTNQLKQHLREHHPDNDLDLVRSGPRLGGSQIYSTEQRKLGASRSFIRMAKPGVKTSLLANADSNRVLLSDLEASVSKFHCSICGKSFSAVDDYRQHMAQLHDLWVSGRVQVVKLLIGIRSQSTVPAAQTATTQGKSIFTETPAESLTWEEVRNMDIQLIRIDLLRPSLVKLFRDQCGLSPNGIHSWATLRTMCSKNSKSRILSTIILCLQVSQTLERLDSNTKDHSEILLMHTQLKSYLEVAITSCRLKHIDAKNELWRRTFTDHELAEHRSLITSVSNVSDAEIIGSLQSRELEQLNTLQSQELQILNDELRALERKMQNPRSDLSSNPSPLETHLTLALQKDDQWTGWQAHFPIQERVSQMKLMVDSLQTLHPPILLHRATEVTINFERELFRSQETKQGYRREFGNKLQRIDRLHRLQLPAPGMRENEQRVQLLQKQDQAQPEIQEQQEQPLKTAMDPVQEYRAQHPFAASVPDDWIRYVLMWPERQEQHTATAQQAYMQWESLTQEQRQAHLNSQTTSTEGDKRLEIADTNTEVYVKLTSEDNRVINERAAKIAKGTTAQVMQQILTTMNPELCAQLREKGIEPMIYYFRKLASVEFRSWQMQSDSLTRPEAYTISQANISSPELLAFAKSLRSLSAFASTSSDFRNPKEAGHYQQDVSTGAFINKTTPEPGSLSPRSNAGQVSESSVFEPYSHLDLPFESQSPGKSNDASSSSNPQLLDTIPDSWFTTYDEATKIPSAPVPETNNPSVSWDQYEILNQSIDPKFLWQIQGVKSPSPLQSYRASDTIRPDDYRSTNGKFSDDQRLTRPSHDLSNTNANDKRVTVGNLMNQFEHEEQRQLGPFSSGLQSVDPLEVAWSDWEHNLNQSRSSHWADARQQPEISQPYYVSPPAPPPLPPVERLQHSLRPSSPHPLNSSVSSTQQAGPVEPLVRENPSAAKIYNPDDSSTQKPRKSQWYSLNPNQAVPLPEDLIKCFCGSIQDDGNIIHCPRCDKWQHIGCYYRGRKVPHEHVCAECKLDAVRTRGYTHDLQPGEQKLNTENGNRSARDYDKAMMSRFRSA